MYLLGRDGIPCFVKHDLGYYRKKVSLEVVYTDVSHTEQAHLQLLNYMGYTEELFSCIAKSWEPVYDRENT